MQLTSPPRRRPARGYAAFRCSRERQAVRSLISTAMALADQLETTIIGRPQVQAAEVDDEAEESVVALDADLVALAVSRMILERALDIGGAEARYALTGGPSFRARAFLPRRACCQRTARQGAGGLPVHGFFSHGEFSRATKR